MSDAHSNFKKIFYTVVFAIFSTAQASIVDDMLPGSEERGQSSRIQNISASDLTHFKGDLVAPTFRTIKELSMSGSQQYTIDFLREKIMPKIVEESDIPLKNVIFVDLREEPHFMFGCNATVSIEGAGADYYRGLSIGEVMATEQSFTERFPKYLTEKECVEYLGARYHRIAVTDINRPEDSDVDEFVKFFKKLKKKEKRKGEKHWLHFHCLAGQGRTTTFMSMSEMLQTSGPYMQSFKGILDNQHKVGGADLLNMWYAPSHVGWVNFLENFYEYAKDKKNGYRSGALWSEWVTLKKISVFQEKPANYSWWSFGRLSSNIQAFVMITSMKISQAYRYVTWP
jgi:hypothetical protein